MTPAILILIGTVLIVVVAAVFGLAGLKFFFIIAVAVGIDVALGFLAATSDGGGQGENGE